MDIGLMVSGFMLRCGMVGQRFFTQVKNGFQGQDPAEETPECSTTS
jgi:hypothetical protein